MIKINRLSDYAVVMLAQLAAQPDLALTTTKIAEETALPLTIVRKLMQQLRDSHLVQATQGHKGGYLLTRCADQISLSEILTAIQGDLALTQCSQSDHKCPVHCQYHFEKHWQHINQSLNAMLSNISLADMMHEKRLNLSLENGGSDG
jgi:FeS assembly SUF system regulator